MHPAVRAANLVCASVRFMLTLEAGRLRPDVYWALAKPAAKLPWLQRTLAAVVPEIVGCYPFYAMGAYPLDMSQYSRLFKSTRLPQIGRDSLITPNNKSRHIVVFRGANVYRIDVLTTTVNGSIVEPVEPASLEAQLRAVIIDDDRRRGAVGVSAAVGVLTAAGRDEWARARAELCRSHVNAASLAEIDSALFALTLDDSMPDSAEELSRTMLHGNGRNRWFDKVRLLVLRARQASPSMCIFTATARVATLFRHLRRSAST